MSTCVEFENYAEIKWLFSQQFLVSMESNLSKGFYLELIFKKTILVLVRTMKVCGQCKGIKSNDYDPIDLIPAMPGFG